MCIRPWVPGRAGVIGGGRIGLGTLFKGGYLPTHTLNYTDTHTHTHRGGIGRWMGREGCGEVLGVVFSGYTPVR